MGSVVLVSKYFAGRDGEAGQGRQGALPVRVGTALTPAPSRGARGRISRCLTWQGLRALADGVVQDSGALAVRRRLETAPGAG